MTARRALRLRREGGRNIAFAQASMLTAPARRHANIHAKIQSFQLSNTWVSKNPAHFMKWSSYSFATFDVNNVSLPCVQCREPCPGMRLGRWGPHIFLFILVRAPRLVASWPACILLQTGPAWKQAPFGYLLPKYTRNCWSLGKRAPWEISNLQLWAQHGEHEPSAPRRCLVLFRSHLEFLK